MTIRTLFAAIAALGMSTAFAASAVAPNELKAIEAPIQNYFMAQKTGDAQYLLKAFSPDAKIIGHINGVLSNLTLTEFAARFSGKPADDEAQRKREFEILSVSGNAAVIKVSLDYPKIKFTDYMSLLKLDGEWKIVNKSYHSEAKAAP
jgi:Putative lumazine-binding